MTRQVAIRQSRRLEFNFQQLDEDIAERGIDAVLADMNASFDKNADRRLYAALDSLRSVLQRHPEQLWFQLAARTRLKGWEDIQEQLAAARPGEMLVPMTSSKTKPLPSVLLTLPLEEQTVTHLRMSSDGKELYCGTFKSGLYVIDPQTLAIQRQLSIEGRVLSTMLGPDGKDVVVVTRGEPGHFRGSLTLCNSDTGDVVVDIPDSLRFGFPISGPGAPPPMQTTPDGQHIVFWYGEAFIDRDLAGLQNAHRFRSRTAPSGLSAVFMAFRDEKNVVSVDEGGFVRVFEYPGGKELYPPKRLTQSIQCVAISPDATLLACCGNVPKGEPEELRGGVRRRHFQQVVVIWDLTVHQEIARLYPTDRLNSLAFQGNDTIVSGNSTGDVQRWRIDSPEPTSTVAAFNNGIGAIVQTPDRDRVIASDFKRVRLIDLTSKEGRPTSLASGKVQPICNAVDWNGQWQAPFPRCDHHLGIWPRF